MCDGFDNDCDGILYPEETDSDLDGYADCEGDCNDGDPSLHPGAEETCDAADNDCNGILDDGFDGDGDGVTTCGADGTPGTADDDCDDGDASVHPGAVDQCDGLADNDCDGQSDPLETDDDGDGLSDCEGDCDDADASLNLDDADGDGTDSCAGDCDDGDPAIHPGAAETCNGVDDDCDGILPPEELDGDGDGHIACVDCDDADAALNLDDADGDGFDSCGVLAGAADCDDGDPSVHPADLDGDGWSPCDGDCDDGDAGLQLDDADADGWTTCDGDCDDGDAALQLDDADGDGFDTCAGDCDDGLADTFPGAAELCDGADNDCDGSVPPEETDDDGDGWWPCEGDCDDSDPELDPGDLDGDGYSSCAGDCEDDDPDAYPDATEFCNGIDSDCDGAVDDDCIACDQRVPSDVATIQAAIDAAAAGSGICVEPGTYYETLDIADQGIHLLGLEGSEVTVIDGQGGGPVIDMDPDNGNPSTIEGLTIQNGSYMYGGGLNISTATTTVRDVVVRDCDALPYGWGGGLYAYSGGHPTFIDVRFEDNEAGYGGGAFFAGTATVSGAVFEDNEAVWGGGGAYLESGVVSISGAVFRDNASSMILDGGGGAIFTEGTLRLYDSVVEGNESTSRGGAILADQSSIELYNSIFANNYASMKGGAIYNDYGYSTVVNCTFVDNDGHDGGAMYLDDGFATIDNTVFASNVADYCSGGVMAYSIVMTYRNNDSWNNVPGNYCGMNDPTGTNGNLSVNPSFLDTAPNDPWTWDLHLATSSPLIDAGRSSVDDPDGSRSDMGAYGGARAGRIDRDQDGHPEWWQPGPYDAATYPDQGWDCDDRDAATGPWDGC